MPAPRWLSMKKPALSTAQKIMPASHPMKNPIRISLMIRNPLVRSEGERAASSPSIVGWITV